MISLARLDGVNLEASGAPPGILEPRDPSPELYNGAKRIVRSTEIIFFQEYQPYRERSTEMSGFIVRCEMDEIEDLPRLSSRL